MENNRTAKRLMLFFGITLFTQAVTSLVGGSIFMSPFESSSITSETLIDIAGKIPVGYISIVLQVITAIVIVLLGVAMYELGSYKGKTAAIVALCLYVFEAILLAVEQGFVFGLIDASTHYVATGNSDLIVLGNVLSSIEGFIGKIAMIPFGVGAVLFYWLITKAGAVPKWLGWYGIVTAPLILIGTPLMAFGIDLPFWVLVPYVPFEFFTGIFVIVNAARMKKA